MNFLNGITILLIYQMMGEITVWLLDIPIPGPVVGMLMLFVTLLIRKGLPEFIEQSSAALLSHLSLLFVPAGVGVMVHWQKLSVEWLPIIVALIVSTAITLAGSAGLMLLLQKLLNRRGSNRD
jgi:holin-like protein